MNSQLTSEQIARIRELIQAVYHEQANPEEMTELRQWIESSREAAWLYAQYMHLFAGLHWDKMHQSAGTSSHDSRTPAGKSPVLGFLGQAFQQGANFFSHGYVLWLLAAMILPGILFLLVILNVVQQTPPTPVAVVSRSRDCAGRLDDRPTTFYPGSNLFSEQTLVIDEGLVEIQFADGARTVLEGPATFVIRGRNAGSLTRGRLAAVVPPEARGFAVETPSARVVDLGTEFGVWVDDRGRVEAHVFGGQIGVTVPTSTDSPGLAALLIKGEAVRIAAADTVGKSPTIVRMPAAAKRFTRSIDLPEPTILFAHHGSADPTTEGWILHYRQYGEGTPEKGKRLAATRAPVGPIEEGGVAAWSFGPLNPERRAFYIIDDDPKQLRAEAQEKGWVLRARVWIGDKGPHPGRESNAPCHFGYRDEEHSWGLWILSDPEGNQYARTTESVFGPFPGSRNQYVDYELRYHPARKNAELFVNGRLMGTFKGAPKRKIDEEEEGHSPLLRFGTYFVPTEVRIAKFEWGILRDAPDVAAKPNNVDQDKK
ncbi:MAG TPA: hypothetical protein DD670_08820 [Planctomycetaceae bacterium]|nr:hypothetical protein [Planctomycetaceae bacterium]